MSGNNVTKSSGTNSRGRGRPRKHTDRAAKQQAYRDRKSNAGTKPPLPRNLNLPFEKRFDLDLLFAGLFRNKLVEVWHARYGRGVVDTVRIYTAGDTPDDLEVIPCRGKLPCRFRSKSGRRHWEYVPFEEVWTLAAHDGVPKHLRWIHEKHRAPRVNRLVQLFDSDRNRDMGGDSEKWNADGGKTADAEVAVQQIYDSLDIKDRVVDIDVIRHPDPAKRYADKLAALVELAYKTQARWSKHELENHNSTNKDGH